jgi:hypothetical protein
MFCKFFLDMADPAAIKGLSPRGDIPAPKYLFMPTKLSSTYPDMPVTFNEPEYTLVPPPSSLLPPPADEYDAGFV